MEEITLLCGTVAEFEPFNVAEGMIDPFWYCIESVPVEHSTTCPTFLKDTFKHFIIRLLKSELPFKCVRIGFELNHCKAYVLT